ncbi:tetratricopeptide repeat protein [Pelagibaculum spongiae]|uniref:Tetratricopeptide repeat-like domain-containing protein n=1 Tax=Pelagibaculum spongiae TaxID=2080658 RepID=A0A2V1GRI3_9GAMM|nr:tetratricopeptide repeat protein [Pelagibaculum spongiae]PVZ62976.1 hypothetical protein DC094_21660 [Pelagibaculum spongiae]
MKQLLLSLLLLTPLANAQEQPRFENPGWGEVVFYHLQDEKQSVLNRLLLAERNQDLELYQAQSDLLLGGLFLELGLFERAQPLFEKARQSTNDVSAQAWLTLSGQLAKASRTQLLADALQRIDVKKLTEDEQELFWLYQAELAKLQSNIVLLDQSISKLSKQHSQYPYLQIQRFLLGSETGQQQELNRLIELTRQKNQNYEQIAVSSRASLMLGQFFLSQENYAEAKRYFEQVSETSPDRTRALLGIGWSEAKAGRQQQSVLAWKKLSRGNLSNVVTLESKIALPYLLEASKPTQAIDFYEQALLDFNDELIRLKQIELELDQQQWIAQLVENGAEGLIYPGYFIALLENNNFQDLLANYQQLNFLGDGLDVWQPKLSQAIFQLDFRIKKQQRYQQISPLLMERKSLLMQRLKEIEGKKILASQGGELASTLVADNQQQQQLIQLETISSKLQRSLGDVKSEQQRARFLKGRLLWQVEQDYYSNLRRLDKQVMQTKVLVKDLQQQVQELQALADGLPTQLNQSRQLLTQASARLNAILAFKNGVEDRIKNQLQDHMQQQIVQRRTLLNNLLEVALDGTARLYDQSISRRQGASL